MQHTIPLDCAHLNLLLTAWLWSFLSFSFIYSGLRLNWEGILWVCILSKRTSLCKRTPVGIVDVNSFEFVSLHKCSGCCLWLRVHGLGSGPWAGWEGNPATKVHQEESHWSVPDVILQSVETQIHFLRSRTQSLPLLQEPPPSLCWDFLFITVGRRQISLASKQMFTKEVLLTDQLQNPSLQSFRKSDALCPSSHSSSVAKTYIQNYYCNVL